MINSSHCPFVIMAEYQYCDRNAGHAGNCVRFTAAPEPNLHRSEEPCLKQDRDTAKPALVRVSLSPRVCFACAILGSVALKLFHWPKPAWFRSQRRPSEYHRTFLPTFEDEAAKCRTLLSRGCSTRVIPARHSMFRPFCPGYRGVDDELPSRARRTRFGRVRRADATVTELLQAPRRVDYRV